MTSRVQAEEMGEGRYLALLWGWSQLVGRSMLEKVLELTAEGVGGR